MSWQKVRTEVRSLENAGLKVGAVNRFLQDNPTYENAMRVLNWAKMSKVAYRDDISKKHFDILIDYIEDKEWTEHEKEPIGPEDFATKDIQLVLKDLSKRKNAFQHGGKKPAQQKEFEEKLIAELEKRGIEIK